MQTYATANEIRLEAWFQWNANVTNELIEKYLIMWHSIVLSKIAWKYDTTLFSENDNFTWSQAESFLKTAEILISSWLLLEKEYWNEALNTDKEGARRFKEWNEMLMMMYDAKSPVLLIWNDGSEYPRKSVSSAWSITWPAFASGDAFFSVNMRI